MRKSTRRPCTKNPGRRKHVIVPKRTKVGPLRKPKSKKTIKKEWPEEEDASPEILKYFKRQTYRN